MLVSSILISIYSCQGERKIWKPWPSATGVSHLQDQGRLGFQSWLRVFLFDSVTKNTLEIMSKLVNACQDVPCLAGLYQLGGTTYSLGSHFMGCDYADLSGVKKNQTFPSLCCLRKHKGVAANNTEY